MNRVAWIAEAYLEIGDPGAAATNRCAQVGDSGIRQSKK